MRSLAQIIAGLVYVRNNKGVTAIEYGLLAALISLAIIGAVSLLGVNLAALFTDVAEKVAAPAD